MSVAYLPSPARGVWQLGPVPVRAYALCAVLGIVVALWLTDRRYRRMGGPRGMILDVATVAVPAGIVGARIYGVLADYKLYFGPGRDWVSVLRIWDGGLGIAAIAAAGALGAWAYCRRHRYALAPMALAAAPALAVAQAIGTWGNWFSQRMYGSPSTLPFAVAIGPARRANGYESFSTFQPVFLYESLWDILVAVAVLYAIRRLLLTGDRAFALYAALQAAGRLTAEITRIDYSPRLLGTRVTEFGMLLVILVATAYLVISRARGLPPAVGQVPAAGGQASTLADSVASTLADGLASAAAGGLAGAAADSLASAAAGGQDPVVIPDAPVSPAPTSAPPVSTGPVSTGPVSTGRSARGRAVRDQPAWARKAR
jgi:prolipoprotein diacylglyceryl transferase